ncbi:MAG: VanW family protein [Clostridia bacterium]|nr:VanW family protein [Clostridia bacterium]
MDTAKTHGSDAPTGEVKKKKRSDKTLIPARTKKARKTAASKKKKAVSLFGDDIMPAAKAKKHTKRKSKKSKREKYCWWALPVSCLCLLVVAVVVTLGIRESQNYDLFKTMKTAVLSDAFYDGIYIESYDVSGHQLDEIREFWARNVEKPYRETSIVFEVEGESFCLTAEELGYSSDYEKVLLTAYNSGRLGSLEERARVIGARRENNERFSVNRQLYDPEVLRSVTDSIAEKCTHEAKNASIADFDFNAKTFTFSSEIAGTYVDADDLYQKASALMESGGGLLKVDVEIIEPTTERGELENAYGMIAQAVTNASSSSKSRLNNVNLACMSISGTCVAPGETFSFNDTVGKRTKAKGYKIATVYQSGEVTEDIGGGVCQVSTTLWNAAMKADCELVERHEHSRPVAYVDKGKDATVSWGSQDMKFKNNSDEPIYIVAYLNEKKRVVVEIYGKLFEDGKYIEITQKVTKKYSPPEAVRIYNPTLAKGEEVVVSEARTGYRAVAYRVYYDKDGNVLDTVELCRSYYKEAAARIEYGA